MDRLWSPWRYRYISTAGAQRGCIFCEIPQEARDAENFVLHRAEHNFVLLNLFPYTSGHLMVAPYRHISRLEDAEPAELHELISLGQRAEALLRKVYRAPGMNLGMNIGEAGGAGIAGHIHMHVLPRWPGDANFMSTVGETRVLPEDLPATWEKLRTGWR